MRAELEARVRALGVADSVVLAGAADRSEIPVYMAAADIVAVPSIRFGGYVDGLPNVALEAMAAGKPLVASRVGGLPELVRDGENGVLVAEKEVHALADAIVDLAATAARPTRRDGAGDQRRRTAGPAWRSASWGSHRASPARDSRPAAWGRLALGVSFVAVLAVGIALGVRVMIDGYSPVPFADFWEQFPFIERSLRGDLGIDDLWAQANEHRIALARVQFLLDYRLFDGTNVFLFAAIAASSLLLAATLAAAVWLDTRDGC